MIYSVLFFEKKHKSMFDKFFIFQKYLTLFVR